MLSELAVRKAKPSEKPYKLFDSRGLYVLVHPNGSKYWRLKYRINGNDKTLAIGVYPEISLVEARDERDDARKLMRDGKDPAEVRKEKKRAAEDASANTFEAIAREWINKQKNVWSADHMQTVLDSLEDDAFPEIGHKPIMQVTTADIRRILKKIEERGAYDIARRVHGRVRSVFEYAVVWEKCETNPAAFNFRSVCTAPEKKHYPALPAKELPTFLEKLRNYNGTKLTVRAVRLLMFTWVRTGEMRPAKWAEFDLDKAEWIIPGSRMKSKRTQKKEDHYVPLSTQAVNELRELHKLTGDHSSGYLFPINGTKGEYISENRVTDAIERLGYRGKHTGHGFRAMASTILNEQGWNPDAIERQLAHTEKNKVRAAYHRAQYLEERRKLMQAWGDYIEALENGGAKVIPIRSGERA